MDVNQQSELEHLVPMIKDSNNREGPLPDKHISGDKFILSPDRVANNNRQHMNVVDNGNNTASIPRPTRTLNPVGSSSRIPYPKDKQRSALRDSHKSTNILIRPRLTHSSKVQNSANVRHHCFISEVPDVRHMERALLGLLADFHSGKLRAFGSGQTMEQMASIREQQEKLAKLHFDLGAVNDSSLTNENFRRSQNTMNQLIQRLEHLSVSIEGLHRNTTD